MARLAFEGLPAFAYLGSDLEGTLVIESDRPIDPRAVHLTLRGTEISQATVSTGKSTERIVDRAEFLVSEVALPLGAPGSSPPGGLRVPFRTSLPAGGPPSLETATVPAERGRWTSRPDGMYVEYLLEARLEVPWWIDPVDVVAVPVVPPPPPGSLGPVGPVAAGVGPDRPTVLLTPDAATADPGRPLAGNYEIRNPTGKQLRRLEIALARTVEYQVRSLRRTAVGPRFAVEVPLDTRVQWTSGRFVLPLGAGPDLGPGRTGRLYRSSWSLSAHLDVALGFDVRGAAPVGPGSA